MEKIYNRKYISKIKELSEYFPVIGIIGARQVGKTTIARLLKNKLSKSLHYIDLELLSDYHKLENPEIYLSSYKDKCIVIDEIQLKPDLFPLLRALTDQTGESCQFIITGSASPDMLHQSTETLAGRIAYVEISGFSFDELPESIDIETHWFRGGFPRALFAPNHSLFRSWIENFIKTYIERDLNMLGLSAEPLMLRRLWSMLAHSHGCIINYSNLSGSLGISINTVKKYIDFFEHAFLIKRILPYIGNIKKRIVKSPKIYLTDTGILHSLLRIENFDDLQGHPSLGNSWEGYCINQILDVVKDKFEVHFYRTLDGSECDLVLSKGQKAIYTIEIKYSAAPKLTRGNTIAFSKINAEKNFVITPKGDNYLIKENIRTCSLRAFINQYLIQISK